MLDLSGIHVTTITPFKEKTFELDLPGLAENIQFLSESRGVTGIVPLGTVGEFPSASTEERKQITKTVLDAAHGRKTIIVGCSHTNHVEVIELARYAKDCGADAVLIVPPTYYMKDAEEGFIHFLELVTSKIDIGLILYNLPLTTRTNLTPTLMLKILERVNGIVGLKDGTKDLSQLAETLKVVGKKIPVVVGAEELMYYGLIAGGRGATSSIANYAPDIVGDLIKAHLSGDHEKARSLYFEYVVPLRHMDLAAITAGIPIQIAQTKETMNLLGMAGGTVRPPLVPLSAAQKIRLKEILIELKIASPKKLLA
ncbi:MAG: dihydrodipicolinate synthase family protein [Thaumarchaeota archaeon]|nr:dihydrodipicolinate synthase family protein [Nitrososphaerota archaeon]